MPPTSTPPGTIRCSRAADESSRSHSGSTERFRISRPGDPLLPEAIPHPEVRIILRSICYSCDATKYRRIGQRRLSQVHPVTPDPTSDHAVNRGERVALMIEVAMTHGPMPQCTERMRLWPSVVAPLKLRHAEWANVGVSGPELGSFFDNSL